MENKTCFCSWSGGKDSCFALYKTMSMGYEPKFLLTTCLESGSRSRSHGLATEILEAQAASINLPLVCCNTSWTDYRRNFINTLLDTKRSIADTTVGVFGDIDIEEHRQWVQEVCIEVDCEPLLPLWQTNRKALLTEFINLGFKATIVAVASDKMSPGYLDRKIDLKLIDELAQLDIDPCGENGEFHTIVTDGPLFNYPINITKKDAPQLRENYWYQDYYLLT